MCSVGVAENCHSSLLSEEDTNVYGQSLDPAVEDNVTLCGEKVAS